MNSLAGLNCSSVLWRAGMLLLLLLLWRGLDLLTLLLWLLEQGRLVLLRL